MQRVKKYYYVWRICTQCEKRTRKRCALGQEKEIDDVICDQCKREWNNKNYGRIYPSRRRVQHGDALSGAAAAHR